MSLGVHPSQRPPSPSPRLPPGPAGVAAPGRASGSVESVPVAAGLRLVAGARPSFPVISCDGWAVAAAAVPVTSPTWQLS